MIKRLSAEYFHPASWWLLGLIFVATAVVARSTVLLVGLACLAAALTVIFDSQWYQSLRFYGLMALFILVTRVAFRIIFNFGTPSGEVLLNLPQFEINLGFGSPVTLLGALSNTTLEFALRDGLRLAAIILSIGMANSLCNPRKLLKFTPGALYEIASAVSMAINLAPQLVQSAQRVRQSRELRGRSNRLSTMASVIVPVLEDTIESSMSLAASMTSRGFGRAGNQSTREKRALRLISLVSVVLILIGTYFAITLGVFHPATGTTLITGILLGLIAIRMSSIKQIRTALERRKLSARDYLLLSIGVILLISSNGTWWNA
jgi:energy-coupling factor transport system permease protein